MRKLRVAILFGGKSAEHEVSIQSARNVYNALDRKKYTPVLIGIDHAGRWQLGHRAQLLLGALPNTETKSLAITPGGQISSLGQIDVAFPVLHGPFGEDGTVQGLFKLANIPFVGADVLGSTLGMDKDVQKRLLKQAGMPIAKFLVLHRHERWRWTFNRVRRTLGLPFFIKPANLGSSVGVHKVHDQREFRRALTDTFHFDTKILAEEFIEGREIECAVLGNDHPRASVPGEVVTHHDFYSYEAKYVDEHGAKLIIPAKLPKRITREVRRLAVKVFQVLECSGMARVDFFVTKRSRIVVNEINTIPGFTNISMYPRLWAASGVSYSKLIDRLIELALKRHSRQQRLQTSYR